VIFGLKQHLCFLVCFLGQVASDLCERPVVHISVKVASVINVYDAHTDRCDFVAHRVWHGIQEWTTPLWRGVMWHRWVVKGLQPCTVCLIGQTPVGVGEFVLLCHSVMLSSDVNKSCSFISIVVSLLNLT